MMLFIDRLPDTKSETGRGFQFWKFDTDHSISCDSPVGMLSLESPGKRCEFLVEEFPVPMGRGFQLSKMCGAIGKHDTEETGYAVFVCRRGKASCECKGYARWGKCKHAEAIASCLEQGWL